MLALISEVSKLPNPDPEKQKIKITLLSPSNIWNFFKVSSAKLRARQYNAYASALIPATLYDFAT